MTSGFTKQEMFGLAAQARRAAGSMGANIAEGCGGEGEADFVRFRHIARGSACELEYHLLLAHELGLLEGSVHQNLNGELSELKRMLTGFIQKVNARRKTLDTRYLIPDT